MIGLYFYANSIADLVIEMARKDRLKRRTLAQTQSVLCGSALKNFMGNSRL
jgi:hypothetical protein